MTASLTVRFVDSEQAIPATLWEACLPPPLEGRWWYAALEQSGLEEQFVFRYAVLCDGARPVGIAPFFLMDVPLDIVVPEVLLPLAKGLGHVFPALRHQRTLFVGSPCADEGSIGLLPEVDRREAFFVLQQALDREARRSGCPMLVWKDFPDAYAPDMHWLAARTGLFPMVSFPGTVAALPGPTMEDFFGAMKGTRRRQLKKKLRVSAASVAIDTQVIQHPDAPTLAEIFALFWKTYEHAQTKFERLDMAFFTAISRLPLAHFITLRHADTGEMLAFMLCFDMGERVINKYIGLDYGRPKEWSLYFRLWEAVVTWSLSRGARMIQSGQTGYAPKMEMGHTLVPLSNYCKHRNHIIHTIYKLVAKHITWDTLDPVLRHYTHETTVPK